MRKKLSCLVLGVAVLAAAVGGRPSSAQTPVSADEIRFVMPYGWVRKEAPAPGTLAYYVLMYQGKPYGEMYLSKEPLPSALSARQVLEEGLRKNSAGLQGYHPMGTFPVSAAGVSDAVAHDFTYFPAQSPVPFTGRVVVLVVGNASYTFFFNTTSSFFPSVKGSFGDVTASIQAVPKPPVQEVKKAEPRTVEEHGFTMTLAGGWSDSGDAMGAKYRYAGADGHYLASFFPFGKDEKAGVTALFALMEKRDALEAVLASKVRDDFPGYGDYTAVDTFRRKVAGSDAIIHDFRSRKENVQVMFRWCIVAVSAVPANETTLTAPSVYDFAFLTSHPDRFGELKPVFDAVLDSMKPSVPLPLRPEAPAVQEGTTPPSGAVGQGLPELGDEEVFSAPDGRFTVALPPGAVKDGAPRPEFSAPSGEVATYGIAGKEKTVVVLHLFNAPPEGEAYRDNLAAARGGRAAGDVVMDAGRRKVPVRIYQTLDGQVLVAALFPADGLFIGVQLPKEAYSGSRGWIQDLITGVRFREGE